MVIILDTPFAVGDLSPNTYPHVYITRFEINNPARTVRLIWQVGTVQDDGAWISAPDVPEGSVNLAGSDLYPFFMMQPMNMNEPLWNQVSMVCYQEVQRVVPRYAGKLGSGVPDEPVVEPLPQKSEPEIPKEADAEGTTETPATDEPATLTAPSMDTEVISGPDHIDGRESLPTFERVVDA